MKKDSVSTEPTLASKKPEVVISSQKCSPLKAVVTIIVIAVVLVLAYYSFDPIKNKLGLSSSPNVGQEQKSQEEMIKEITNIVAKAGKLMILPNEVPQMATVVDPESLIKQQSFYQGVVDGDKVLLFIQARKAVIYSPSRNIIVNAGPVYLNEGSQPTKAQSTTAAQQNGSKRSTTTIGN